MNGQQCWEGYPYSSDEDMSKDLNRLLDPVFYDDSSPLKPDEAIVFMTHVGPDQTGKFSVTYQYQEYLCTLASIVCQGFIQWKFCSRHVFNLGLYMSTIWPMGHTTAYLLMLYIYIVMFRYDICTTRPSQSD